MRNPGLTEPLRRPVFRRLATTYAVNELGDWMGIVALSVLVFDRTDSALATAGLFLGTRFLPGPAGAGPRRPRRAAAAALRAAGHLLRRGGGLRRPGPARRPLLAGRGDRAGRDRRRAGPDRPLPDPRRRRRAARARGRAARRQRDPQRRLHRRAPRSAPASPASSSPASASRPRCCSTRSPSTLIAWILLTAGPLPQAEPEPGRMRDRVRAGARLHPGDSVRLRRLLIAQGAAFIFFAAVIPIEVIYAKETLGAGDSGYGLMLASWGAGMVLGSLVFADDAAGAAALPALLQHPGRRRRLPRARRRADPGRGLRRLGASAAPATACSGWRRSAPSRS